MTEIDRDGAMVLVPGLWRPEDRVGILPELLEQGRRTMTALLVQAGEKAAAEALMPLLMTQIMPNTDGMSDETVQAFAAAKIPEYSRLLAKYPVDILRAACDAHAESGSQFFPAVYDLTRHAKPALEKRQRQADRIERLIEHARRPKAEQKPAFVPEPEHVRLLHLLGHYEQPGRLYSPTKARATRARLLELGHAAPGEPPPVEESTPEMAPTLPQELPPSTFTKASDAAPNLWRAGEAIYQQRSEEPPPPDDIPEAEVGP